MKDVRTEIFNIRYSSIRLWSWGRGAPGSFRTRGVGVTKSKLWKEVNENRKVRLR